MSEAKRVPLQTLEFPESLGHAAKKEKKGEKGRQLAPSFRFTLTLPESNEKACPEFNYAQLLKSAEKKRRKEQKNIENTTNGLVPFDDDDDEDLLRDMARRFETKYGTATMGRKRQKYDDYVDLGAGYDENDSFIDNTDAYDEIVPEEYTTAHGGFYINCGPLEFKTADRHSLVHNNNNNNDNNNDDDESNECSDDDTEGGGSSPKRTLDKRILSTSDEEEAEDIGGGQARKKRKIDENGDKKSPHENVIKKKKKQQQNQEQQDGDMSNRRKEKNETTDADGGTASEDQEEKKRPEKEPQKSKSISEKKFDLKKFEKKPSSASSNGYDAKKVEVKKPAGKESNVDDAIESVVNAARVEDESTTDSMDSAKSKGILATESECDDADKEEAPLPESLPEDVKELVNTIKHHTENSKESKGKFFSLTVNTALFSLEKRLRTLNIPSVRLQTYAYLARFLPCSKTTLLNRAKKLYLQDAEYRVREPMQRLKAIIDNVMPSVMDRYIKECQKVADEKGLETSPVDGESSEDEDASNKSEKSKIPKKRFPWTEETKKIILEIANARRQYFKILRPRKESMESFVATFMETKVLPLWPANCVRLQTLLKYSNSVEPVIKKKVKKLKDICSANIISATNTVCNSTTRVEPSSANNATNQERENQVTNSSKHSASENTTNFTNQALIKTDSNVDKKQQQVSKHKEKNKEISNTTQQENPSVNSSTVGKISVVPTSQLMAQKPSKTHVDKFNLMELSNSSLSITPVNDYHKSSVKPSEIKKDIVSITAYPEPSNLTSNSNETQSHLSVHRQESTYPQHSNYQVPNQTLQSNHSKPTVLKHAILPENESQSEKKIDDKDVDVNKTEKKDKRRDRTDNNKQHKVQEVKKRKKDSKGIEQQSMGCVNSEIVPVTVQHTSLTKEEQEQRQIEETVAATNYLSQIINEDSSVRAVNDKRKDPLSIEESMANLVQPTEQEKNVQMVMKSLKELQELQEMKYSPSHSPGGIQKPGKSNAPYVSYQDDYQRYYIKKDEKLRPKEEAQW